MLRFCIECREVFGCVEKGKSKVCFIDSENHCENLASCTDRLDYNPRTFTKGICEGCMTQINVKRALLGKNTVAINQPASIWAQ